MSWGVIFMMANSLSGVGDAALFWFPAADCEAALAAIEPLQRALDAACISPTGEVFGWE